MMAPPGFADAIAWFAPIAPGESPQWHVSFTVADRDQTADEAERLGGHVLRRDDTEWSAPHGSVIRRVPNSPRASSRRHQANSLSFASARRRQTTWNSTRYRIVSSSIGPA